MDPDRREACRYDLKLYLETYFAKAVRLGWSDDHLELIDALEKIILDGGQLAIGMPRGTGKTTIVIRAICWALSFGHHKSAMMVAATDPKARKALRGLKKELQTRLTLLEDFPEICFPIRCLQGINNRQGGQTCEGEATVIKFGQDEITFPTIKDSVSSGARIVVGGITGAVTRGEQETHEDGEVIRPSLILIDDPQTRESAKSAEQCQDRLDIIEADIAGAAGPDEAVSMLATVTVIYPDDVADQLLDFELNPDWNGIRKKFLLSEPSNTDLWEEYQALRRQSLRLYRDIRLATAFYHKNRKAMDKGAKVSWEARFRRKQKEVDGKLIDVREISAIQHAMEWMLVKPRAFQSELQNEPEAREQSGKSWLSARQIATKTHALKRFEVPQTLFLTRKLFSHIDVHDDLLYWTVLAAAADGTAGVIGYDTYPEQRSVYFKKSDARVTMQTKHPLGKSAAIRHSLLLTIKQLLDRVYLGQDGFTQFHIDLLGIDCGDGEHRQLVNNIVLELIRDPRYAGRITQTKGIGVRASDTPFAERSNPAGTIVGNNVMLKPRQKETDAPRLDIDTNYWKTETNDRFVTAVGTNGCLTLHAHDSQGRRFDHQLFGEHCKAEYAVENSSRGRTVLEFKKLPPDNHYYDNLVACLAMASFRGCDVRANTIPEIPQQRRRRRRRSQTLET